MAFKEHQKSINYTTRYTHRKQLKDSGFKRKFGSQHSGNIHSIYHRSTSMHWHLQEFKEKKLSLVSVCCATRRKFIEKGQKATSTRSTFLLMMHKRKCFDMFFVSSFITWLIHQTKSEANEKEPACTFGKLRMPPTKISSGVTGEDKFSGDQKWINTSTN